MNNDVKTIRALTMHPELAVQLIDNYKLSPGDHRGNAVLAVQNGFYKFWSHKALSAKIDYTPEQQSFIHKVQEGGFSPETQHAILQDYFSSSLTHTLPYGVANNFTVTPLQGELARYWDPTLNEPNFSPEHQDRIRTFLMDNYTPESKILQVVEDYTTSFHIRTLDQPLKAILHHIRPVFDHPTRIWRLPATSKPFFS